MGFVQDFDKLFTGRRDLYAEGYPDPKSEGKFRYAAKMAPLTEDVLAKHLKGDVIVGIYPILSDNTVQWFCVDFDAPKDENDNVLEDPFPAALEAGERQARAFESAGLHVYLERSRSGKGVHVWGFLEEAMQAGVIRLALRPLLTDHTIFESRDRMYPVQDGLTEQKPNGNLIALPFFGKAYEQGNSAFIDRASGEPLDRRGFLQDVRRNSTALLDVLAAKAPKVVRPGNTTVRAAGDYADFESGVTGALKVLSPYGCTFFRHCMEKAKGLAEPKWYAGLQIATHFENGRDLAHLLSMPDPRYDEGSVDMKYDQALQNPRIGCSWIHENYPELACKNCPSKNGVLLAPHHLAKRSILDLAGGKREKMKAVGSFKQDLERARKLQQGLQLSGQRWGIPGLDEYTRLRNSEFIAIGAAPSMGKTWMFTNAMLQCARPNKYREGMFVFGFSAETGEESLRTRLLATASGVDSRKISGEAKEPITNDEWARMEEASEELAQLPIHIDYTSLNADDVLLQVESVLLERRVPLDTLFVVFFDYLQFGSKMLGDASEYDRISRLSTEFKFAAKILKRPIVVFSQLKREAEGSEEPILTWFKNSGRIESDIDLGMIITGERMSGEYAPRRLTIVKQREGIGGNLGLDFSLNQTCGQWKYVGGEYPSETMGNLGDPIFGHIGGDALA